MYDAIKMYKIVYHLPPLKIKSDTFLRSSKKAERQETSKSCERSRSRIMGPNTLSSVKIH